MTRPCAKAFPLPAKAVGLAPAASQNGNSSILSWTIARSCSAVRAFFTNAPMRATVRLQPVASASEPGQFAAPVVPDRLGAAGVLL